MKDTKYLAMDVHSVTISAEVLNEKGTVLMQATLKTKARPILDFISGLKGRVVVAFEEGTHSKWLYDLIRKKVSRVVVCDPRQIKKLGNKCDQVDTHQLATFLRAGLLQPVYQGEPQMRELKELAHHYLRLVGDCTRVMNRIKGIFRSRAIACAGKQVYLAKHRNQWLGLLESPAARLRAEQLYVQLDFLRPQRRAAKVTLLRESRKHGAHRLLKKIPGLGDIGVALILAFVMTPHRFRTKRQFWAYVGLAVVTSSSGDYQVVRGRIVRNKKRILTRGLNDNHNHVLKYVFNVAAQSSSRRGFKEWFQAALAAGISERNARLNLARKISAIALTVWKEGKPYDEKLSKRAA
jgi:transposase